MAAFALLGNIETSFRRNRRIIRRVSLQRRKMGFVVKKSRRPGAKGELGGKAVRARDKAANGWEDLRT